MCDLGSITSILQPTAGEFTAGELLGQTAGVVETFGQAQAARDVERQRDQRAQQILAATKQNLELQAIEQGRKRGTQLAQIGRAGVKLTGSAKQFAEEQARLDEIALESAKQRGVLEIRAEGIEAQAASRKRNLAIGRGFAQAAELAGNVQRGFELG